MEEENIEKDMTPILIGELGLRYATINSEHRRSWGLYQCQYCGKEFEAPKNDINSRRIKSCGCYKISSSILRATKHNLVNHSLYKIYHGMKKRCYNKSSKAYINYGGRGIKIYEEWLLDFNTFYNWALTNEWEEGLTIDRIDVNGNYEPDNCRWTTKLVQSRNTRDIRSTNTSGFRGVREIKGSSNNRWLGEITVNYKKINLGYYSTALEAAKVYETYVRLNNLEHNFTPALTEEEIENLNNQKEEHNENNI